MERYWLVMLAALGAASAGCHHHAAGRDVDGGALVVLDDLPAAPDLSTLTPDDVASVDAGGVDGTGGTADLLTGPDGASLTSLAPLWSQRVDGITETPYARQVAGGEIAWLLTQGYGTVIYGAGESHETSVTAPFKPSLVWLNGDDGQLQRVRSIAGDHPDTTGLANRCAGLVETSTSLIAASCSFGGGVVFNPGSPDSLPIIGERGETASEAFAAIDPFVAFYDGAAAPARLVLGHTLGPIRRNWWNYVGPLVALSDGGVAVAGRVDGPGAKLGGTLIPGSESAYLATIDSLGAVAVLSAATGVQSEYSHLLRGSDGELVWAFALHSATTLGLDPPTAYSITPVDGDVSWILTTLEPTGSPRWARMLGSADGGLVLYRTVRRQSGDLVVLGYALGDTVYLRDETGALLSSHAVGAGWFVAAFTSDGGLRWLRGYDVPGISDVVETSDGSLRLAAYVSENQLQFDGLPSLALPPRAALSDRPYAVVYRLDDDGRRVSAKLIGLNLLGTLTPLGDGGFLVDSVFGSPDQPATVDGDGHFTPLSPCASTVDNCAVLLRFGG